MSQLFSRATFSFLKQEAKIVKLNGSENNFLFKNAKFNGCGIQWFYSNQRTNCESVPPILQVYMRIPRETIQDVNSF